MKHQRGFILYVVWSLPVYPLKPVIVVDARIEFGLYYNVCGERRNQKFLLCTNPVHSGGKVVDLSAASGETYSQLDHGIVKSLQPRSKLPQGHTAEVT